MITYIILVTKGHAYTLRQEYATYDDALEAWASIGNKPGIELVDEATWELPTSTGPITYQLTGE